MKEIKKYLLPFCLLSFLNVALAGFDVGSVKVSCPEKLNCAFLEKRVALAIQGSSNLLELKRNLKFMVQDSLIKSFSFELKEENNIIDISVDADLNLIVKSFEIKGLPSSVRLGEGISGVKEGEAFSFKKLDETKELIEFKLQQEGFYDSTVTMTYTLRNNYVEVLARVKKETR